MIFRGPFCCGTSKKTRPSFDFGLQNLFSWPMFAPKPQNISWPKSYISWPIFPGQVIDTFWTYILACFGRRFLFLRPSGITFSQVRLLLSLSHYDCSYLLQVCSKNNNQLSHL
uniref:Uncharacterized protein n=1 Tax=Opuntia streptacantha TaxID=393608 RepID=A0A7C8ZU12_OPUST